MDLDRLWLLDQSHKLNTIAQRPSSSSVDSLLGLWVQPHTCIWHNGLLCRSSHLPNIHFYTKEPLCQLRVCVWTHCPRYRKICPIRIHFIDRFRWIHRLFPNLFFFKSKDVNDISLVGLGNTRMSHTLVSKSKRIYPNLHNVIASLISPNPLSLNLPLCCHISLPYIPCFDIKIIHQRIQTTHSHGPRCYHCHYCNVNFVWFQNVTCYTNSLLSCVHVNTTNPLKYHVHFGCHMQVIRQIRADIFSFSLRNWCAIYTFLWIDRKFSKSLEL